jgi:hypothetical protein
VESETNDDIARETLPEGLSSINLFFHFRLNQFHLNQGEVCSSSTIYRQHYIQAALYTGSTIYRQHYIQTALYTGSTIYRQHHIQAALYTGSTIYTLELTLETETLVATH